MEGDHPIVKWTTPSLLVDHLYLHQHHVGSVGLGAFRILNSCQFQLSRLSGGLQFIRRERIAHSFKDARLKLHIFKSIEPVQGTLALAQRLSIEQKFHVVARRDDVDVFHHTRLIVPVTNNIGMVVLWLHPAVPHDLVNIEGILGQAHGIDHAASAIVRLAAMVGVGVAEDNFHAATAHTLTRAGALQPIFVPALHHLTGKPVHVVIVVAGGLTTIERPVALLVEGVGIFVPILAQSLVAAILHGPHGMLLRLVDVKHLAAILGFVDVEHLTAADGAATMGVVLVADGFQLQHVLTADALVAAFVEDDARVVAVVDDGIAHQAGALRPAGALHVLLSVASGHGLEQAYAVAALNVLLPRRYVHPTH